MGLSAAAGFDPRVVRRLDGGVRAWLAALGALNVVATLVVAAGASHVCELISDAPALPWLAGAVVGLFWFNILRLTMAAGALAPHLPAEALARWRPPAAPLVFLALFGVLFAQPVLVFVEQPRLDVVAGEARLVETSLRPARGAAAAAASRAHDGKLVQRFRALWRRPLEAAPATLLLAALIGGGALLRALGMRPIRAYEALRHADERALILAADAATARAVAAAFERAGRVLEPAPLYDDPPFNQRPRAPGPRGRIVELTTDDLRRALARGSTLLVLALAALVPAAARAEVGGVPVRPPAGAAAAAETQRWLDLVRGRGDQGGWLVVRGTELNDQVVAGVTLGTLSHAAILDKEKDEVIEAVATGVRVTPVRTLLAQAHRLLIVRPPGWTPEGGRAAVARARAHVGRRYDWLGLVGVNDDARFYCTELAVDAYGGRAQGWKVGRVIYPADLAPLGTLMFDSGPRAGGRLVEARFARRLRDARGVSYAAEVAPGLYRGGQPDADGIAWLKSIGVKTVLNLRHYHGDVEQARVEAAGLRYERLALASSDAPGPDQVARFLALARNPAARPLYVHCLHGVDRTGTLMAVYRMEEQGWTNAEAFAEMEFFDAHGLWRDLRDFVKRYQPLRSRPSAAK